MKGPKQLWILVGGNGAGKSTFYERYLKPLGLPFVNADVIARSEFPEDPEGHSYEAAKLATLFRTEMLRSGTSFCFETVFSHPSKVDFVAQAKALGYEVIMVMIHVECTQLNRARIALRVQQGGHSVPDDRVDGRIPRLLANVKKTIPLCDQVWILDNSLDTNPFARVFALKRGMVVICMDPLPEWAAELLR